MAKFYCEVCGELFEVDEDSGVSNHITEEGEVDEEADANHEPCGDEPLDEPYNDDMDVDPDEEPWGMGMEI